MRFSLYWLLLLLTPTVGLLAQSRTAELSTSLDPRGPPELIVCSQNLENYGLYREVSQRRPGFTLADYEAQEAALLTRLVRRRCDAIAVQELLGSTVEQAQQALDRLAAKLEERSNRRFQTVLGQSNDPRLAVGFLVAEDRAKVLGKVSYARVELPKLSEEGRQQFFSRGPLELQLQVKGRGGAGARVVTLITFHFKSKSTKGGTDPTGMEFEPFRMEMAEALRRIVELRHSQSFAAGQSVLVLLGDRNSNFDSAAARILEGVLQLQFFQENGPCRLSKRGVPLCQAGAAVPQRLFSVLTTDPATKLQPGTQRYGKIYSWIDDIIMPAESLPFAWRGADTEGHYASGVDYLPAEASDHALVWVELNWR